MSHSPFYRKSIKNKFIIVAITLLIISNLVFIGTTIFYKSKLNTAESKLAPENYKVYSFDGESSDIKITNGIVTISPSNELVNGGNVQYVGKSNVKIISYTNTLYLDKEGKKDIILSNSYSLGDQKGATFSEEFSSIKNIGWISSKDLFSSDDLKTISSNLYYSIDYVKDNFERGNFTIKLKVTELSM